MGGMMSWLPSVVALVLCGIGDIGCIGGDARRGSADSAVATDTATTDSAVADTGVGPDTGDGTDAGDTSDAPDVIGSECDDANACTQPSAPCAESVCVHGFCLQRRKDGGSPCDDHNPCTGDGSCQGDACLPGTPIEDDSPCDTDTLFCNGYGQCQSGECEVSIVGACPQLGAECVDRYECSEALQGACAPVPSEDGSDCNLDGAAGECASGVCVPPGMVVVPSGAFLMGCDPGALCGLDARPKHDVFLSTFAIDRLEVTEGEWKRCVENERCDPRQNESDPTLHNADPDLPLAFVDWPRASQICHAAGKSLCSEAQWEKAARGTAGTFFFPWGNLPASCERAQFYELASGKGCGTGAAAPVGGRPDGACPYGALDMAGNVAEWVYDGYDPNTYAEQEPGTPTDPIVGLDAEQSQIRVIRGGGWNSGVDDIRAFQRRAESAILYDNAVGVRCCYTPPASGLGGGRP
ncbi:MAG: formylglycine-generating enzyme family protein [Myxococcota bacterium]